jgi:hypothetical protein
MLSGLVFHPGDLGLQGCQLFLQVLLDEDTSLISQLGLSPAQVVSADFSK